MAFILQIEVMERHESLKAVHGFADYRKCLKAHLIYWSSVCHDLALVKHIITIVLRCIVVREVTDNMDVMTKSSEFPQHRLKGFEVRYGRVRESPRTRYVALIWLCNATANSTT